MGALPVARCFPGESDSVEHAVQSNSICLNGAKDGLVSEHIERVGLISGAGTAMQTGGNKVTDRLQLGLNMTQLVCGSQGNLGCLFEVLFRE